MKHFKSLPQKEHAAESYLDFAQAQDTILAPSTTTATPAPSSPKPIPEVALAQSPTTTVTIEDGPYPTTSIEGASGSTLLEMFQNTIDILGSSYFPEVDSMVAAVLSCIHLVQMADENTETFRPLANDMAWILFIYKNVKNIYGVNNELKDLFCNLTLDIQGLHFDIKLREERGKMKEYIQSPKFIRNLEDIDRDIKSAINKFHGLIHIKTEEECHLRTELKKLMEKEENVLRSKRGESSGELERFMEKEDDVKWLKRVESRGELKVGEVREIWEDVTINGKEVNPSSKQNVFKTVLLK